MEIKKEVKIPKRKKIGYKNWWDRSCTKKKRLTHRMCIKWRRGKIRREEYIEKRRELKEFLKIKRKKRRRDGTKKLIQHGRRMEIYKQEERQKKWKSWCNKNGGIGRIFHRPIGWKKG